MHVRNATFEDCDALGAGMKAVVDEGVWLATEAAAELELANRPEEVHKIELEVFPENEAAIALYRKLGFEEEGLRRDHYRRRDGGLRSALIMARLFT